MAEIIKIDVGCSPGGIVTVYRMERGEHHSSTEKLFHCPRPEAEALLRELQAVLSPTPQGEGSILAQRVSVLERRVDALEAKLLDGSAG